MATKKIIVRDLCFLNDTIICSVRRGNAEVIKCHPKNIDFKLFSEYKTLELSFSKDGSSCQLHELFGSTLSAISRLIPPNGLIYYRSPFDSKIALSVDYKLYVDIFYYIESQCKISGNWSLDIFFDVEEPDISPEIKKGPVSCRGCGEFDLHGYIEPDNIVDDNKYTCWRCSHSPYRKFSGLTTYEQQAALVQYYKLGK